MAIMPAPDARNVMRRGGLGPWQCHRLVGAHRAAQWTVPRAASSSPRRDIAAMGHFGACARDAAGCRYHLDGFHADLGWRVTIHQQQEELQDSGYPGYETA